MKFSARQRSAVLAASVALAAVAVYANSLANGFAFDDVAIIGDRSLVHGLGRLWEIVTAPYWPEAAFNSGVYRPLTLLSFAVDWQVWGGSPFGFHLTNILVHAVVSGLVVLLLLRFFPGWAAWAGGMIFAVHSVHTEAVANVVGRGELFVALFVLIGCLVYTRAVREGRLSLAATGLIALCYALAGLSKEVGFVMPGLLLATDLPLLAGGADRRRFARLRLPLYVVLTGVLALLFLVRWSVLGAALESIPDRAFTMDDSFPTRVFTMARVWPRYFELLIFPLHLSADYSPAVILPADHVTLAGVVGFLLVVAVVVVAVATFRRTPELALAVVWAGLALLPVSNLVLTAEIVLAERTLYLPSVAVAVVAGLALARAPVGRRGWVAAALAAWVLLFSGVTVRRNPVWDSTGTVFEDLRRHHPESSRLLFALGLRHHERGEWEEAREWFRRSLQVWPWYAPYQAKYALVLLGEGELEEAAERARAAVELDPGFLGHHKLLVLIHLRDNDPAAALNAVERALDVAKPDASLFTQQADAYVGLGDYDGAARAQEAAIREGREDWTTWYRLALFRAAAGDTTAALEALQTARSAPGARSARADSVERAWSTRARVSP